MAGMSAGALTVFIRKSIPVLADFTYELIPGFMTGWVVTYRVTEKGN